MKKYITHFLVSCLLLNSLNVLAQGTAEKFISTEALQPNLKPGEHPKYMNSRLSIDARVKVLVSRLSLVHKIKLLSHHGTAIDSGSVKIPAYNWWNECLHGVARAGKATVFPQTIGLAATWDTGLTYRVANAISDEGRAKYEQFSKNDKRGIYQGLNFWTPNINIFRDPRWGRGMETYGEDPYLTGKMASRFIEGIQGNDPKYYKAIATVKHFVVHSGPEGTRGSFNAEVSDKDLYETYTPAFKMCIQDAKAYSVMCAYNRFRGEPCCGSDFVLNNLLRRQWGFKGFIVTDCGAVDLFYEKGAHEVVNTPEEASAMAIKSGVDLECGDAFQSLDLAIQKNLITEAELDVALIRLFTARFKLGFFDDPKKVTYTQIPYSTVESNAHIKLALEAAQKSIVLLKNQNSLLPLSQDIKTMAVIGPNANDNEIMLANYHGYPSRVVTPLDGLKNKFPRTKILYAKGSRHADGVPSLDVIPANYFFTDKETKHPGLNASYFSNNKYNGQPILNRIDKNIDFYWINDLPVAGFDKENFSAKWTGYIKPEISGLYNLGIYGYDQYKFYLNDSLITSVNSEHEPGLDYKKFTLKAGVAYKVEVQYASSKSAPLIKFKWEMPDQDLQAEALEVCKKADVVVMCMGLSSRLEGEEMRDMSIDGFDRGDRTKLKLPETQMKLMQAVHALGKPIVLVLLNGSAVAVNWENENIPAIVESWYGGQEGGNAIGNVLSGAYNPSGRLPLTFYTSEAQIPAFDNYSMQGRTYRYFKGKPLYEFGYGLSYTTFNYSNFKANNTYVIGKPIKISVDVKNAGNKDGDEVIQLYISKNLSNDADPIRTLKAFQRVSLKKGEVRTVSFDILPKDFANIETATLARLTPGEYVISVGGKQPTYHANGSSQFLSKKVVLKGKVKTVKY